MRGIGVRVAMRTVRGKGVGVPSRCACAVNRTELVAAAKTLGCSGVGVMIVTAMVGVGDALAAVANSVGMAVVRVALVVTLAVAATLALGGKLTAAVSLPLILGLTGADVTTSVDRATLVPACWTDGGGGVKEQAAMIHKRAIEPRNREIRVDRCRLVNTDSSSLAVKICFRRSHATKCAGPMVGGA